MYASVDTARQLQLPFCMLICGTLFRAYGPLGRFRAHLYEYMAKFVVMDFVSSADICVATWSITDICGCTYLRICDGRVNCL